MKQFEISAQTGPANPTLMFGAQIIISPSGRITPGAAREPLHLSQTILCPNHLETALVNFSPPTATNFPPTRVQRFRKKPTYPAVLHHTTVWSASVRINHRVRSINVTRGGGLEELALSLRSASPRLGPAVGDFLVAIRFSALL